MKPTARNLNQLAHDLHTHAVILHDTTTQTLILEHYQLLAGNGLKAAATNNEGGRTSETSSQPETAAINADHPNTAEKAARHIAATLTQLQHLLATLTHIETAAIHKPQPIPTKCRSCSTGQIPVGRTRCTNPECHSHGDTRTTCDIEDCNQRLIIGSTGKTKPHTADGLTICKKHYEQRRRLARYNRVEAERGTPTIGTTNLHLDR